MVLWLWKTNSHNHINGSKGHILGITGVVADAPRHLHKSQTTCDTTPLVWRGVGGTKQRREAAQLIQQNCLDEILPYTPIKHVWWLDSTTGYNTTVLCVFCWTPTGIPPTMFEMMYSWVPICHMAYRRQRVRPAATKSMKVFFSGQWAASCYGDHVLPIGQQQLSHSQAPISVSV